MPNEHLIAWCFRNCEREAACPFSPFSPFVLLSFCRFFLSLRKRDGMMQRQIRPYLSYWPAL